MANLKDSKARGELVAQASRCLLEVYSGMVATCVKLDLETLEAIGGKGKDLGKLAKNATPSAIKELF